MPLRGIKVLEFVGLAPGPFCGKILADFGASVTRLDRIVDNQIDVLKRGKNTLVVNIKNPKTQNFLQSISRQYDVLLDPFRPGVLEKNNLGPDVLLKENPKLIYARITGFGQSGPLSKRAGHDINYVALSGILSFLGRETENPTAPINLLADFAAGGLLCAFGICLALLERHRSEKGQVVDSSMVEGAAYIASWLISSQKLPIWTGSGRGKNILDGGAFYYDTYKTKDGKFMSVGAIEAQFYAKFVKTIGLPDLGQFENNETGKQLVSAKFLTKTQKEWSEIFTGIDACVFPVVEWQNAAEEKHNRFRESFDQDGIPKPAPKLGRTPGKLPTKKTDEVDLYQQAIDVFRGVQMTENDVKRCIDEGVIVVGDQNKL